MSLARRLIFGVVFAAVLAHVPLPADAQLVSREAELKGKVVGVLGKLVTWPSRIAPGPANALTVGIVGTNPFVDTRGVDHLKAKVPDAVVQQFADEDAPGIKNCHILVIADDANSQAALATVAGAPILTVSEAPGLAKQGSAMNLVFDRQQNKIRLEINPKTAVKDGLRINPGLLKASFVDIVKGP